MSVKLDSELHYVRYWRTITADVQMCRKGRRESDAVEIAASSDGGKVKSFFPDISASLFSRLSSAMLLICVQC